MKCLNYLSLVFIVVFAFIGCGSSSTSTDVSGGNTTATGTFTNSDWRLVTGQDLQAGIEFNGASGTLTLINNSGASIASPSFFILNPTAGSESALSVSGAGSIADGETFTGGFTYSGGAEPSSDAFFGLELGDIKIGRFVSSTAFSDLPLTVTQGPTAEVVSSLRKLFAGDDDLPIPQNGTWTLNINATTDDLVGSNCPSSVASLNSSGSTIFGVDCDGYNADLTVDSNHITFDLTSASTGIFRSPEYTFTTLDSEDNTVIGENYYELTAVDSSSMEGTLFWDNNQGCTAEYPITMSLDAAIPFEVNDICEGTWQLTYDSPSFSCGVHTITLPALSFAPNSVGSLSTIDLPSGAPLALTFSSSSGLLHMLRQGCSNSWGNMAAPSVFGFAPTSNGDIVLLSIGFEGFSLSSTELFGTAVTSVMINGIPTCTVPSFYTLEAITPTSC